jgi:lysophospholipase L1-like esterase
MGRINSLLLLLILSSLTASAQIKMRPQIPEEINVLQSPQYVEGLGERFKLIKDSSKPFRIAHIGDSHVHSGFFAEAISDSIKRFCATLPGYDSSNIQLLVMAGNGATAKHFPSTFYEASLLAGFNPDLVIISLGTNEAENGHSVIEMEKYFGTLDSLLRRDAPHASFLFTGAGDAQRKSVTRVRRHKKWKYYTGYIPNQHLPVVNRFLQGFAESHQASFWNWYEVMGGDKTILSWIAQGYAKPDHVHLTEAGYHLEGSLLAGAIIKSLYKLR